MGRLPFSGVLLLALIGTSPAASAETDPGKWVARISPKLAYDPYRNDFHLDLSQPQALGTSSAWDEVTTLLPGLDIPLESLNLVPHVPISQILMGDISMLERDLHSGSKLYGRSTTPFQPAGSNYEPMTEVLSPIPNASLEKTLMARFPPPSPCEKNLSA